MRNLINYYYQLEPKDIHQTEYYYEFEVDGYQYRLQEIYDTNINQIYELSIELYQRGIYTHQIVHTVTNELSVFFNKKIYVLIKYFESDRDNISLEDIRKIQISNFYFDSSKIKNTSNWGELWSQKFDYFEYQMNQFGIKYPIIRNSFAYYVGLAEVGISLFNTYYQENENLYLSHKRIKENSSTYDLYSPFNLVLDLKVRDIAEYFKSLYLKEDIFPKIKDFLEEENLTDYEIIMFFIRMFYPSFYFDKYEQIIETGKDEKDMEEIIKKSSQYDILLKELYNYLLTRINLPYISWLRNF